MARRMTHGHAPGPGASRYTATLDRIGPLSPAVSSFRLSIDPPLMRFLPGQWIDLHMPGAVGGFTIVSAPQDAEQGTIELAVKRLGGGRAAAYLHDHAAGGDRFEVVGPSGDFFLREAAGPPLLLIAGGIGINPLMSMVRHLHRSARSARTTLLYSAKTPSEFVFREELESIARRSPWFASVFTVTGLGAEEWGGRRGRIDRLLLRDLVEPAGTTCYLCGPPGMPTDIAGMLVGLGVPIDAVHFEEW